MKRGDLVLILEPGTPAAKARPYVVVQRDSTLDAPRRITGCPLTSRLKGSAGQRPLAMPSDENGLRHPSEVEIDLIYTHPIERVGPTIGRLDLATMRAVDQALRRWLNL